MENLYFFNLNFYKFKFFDHLKFFILVRLQWYDSTYDTGKTGVVGLKRDVYTYIYIYIQYMCL